MKKWKWVAALSLCFLCLSSCGQADRYTGDVNRIKPLMAATDSGWTKIIEKECGISGFGRPYGAVEETMEIKEDLKTGKKSWTVVFQIDEKITEAMILGYAKAVWEACIKTDGDPMHSANRYYYDEVTQARRKQEPLDYYLWYYFTEEKEYQIGVYSTEMEKGKPGGIVLKVQEWVHE